MQRNDSASSHALSWRSWIGLRRRLENLRRNRGLRIVLIGFLIVITSLAVIVVDSTNRLQHAIQQLNRDFITISEKSMIEITLEDVEVLEASIENLHILAERTDLITLPLRPLASINADWRVSVQFLHIMRDLAQSAQAMLDGIQPVLVFVHANETEAFSTDMTSGARVADLLAFSQPSFDTANDHLVLANANLKAIHLDNVSIDQIMRYDLLVNAFEQLNTYNNVLIDGADVLSVVLGIDDETSYLVLAQNNDEIRPSGGFIGSYGWFTVYNGRITDFDYRPSDENNPNPPSDDFADMLDIPDWWIQYQNPVYAAWDGSWNVDFPTTANLAARYYEAGENPNTPIEAVIAIDIRGFELLLDVIGDVSVVDYGITVNTQNFRDVVYDLRSVGSDTDDHKIFLAAVYGAIQLEWSRLPETELPQLLVALLTGLQEKHILLYYADATPQNAIQQMGWGGKQSSGVGTDYLLVADANLSGNKSNNSIYRSLAYDVEIQLDGSVTQHLTIQYDYLDKIAQNDPAVNPNFHGPLIYLNRLQVFTPPSSQFTPPENTRLEKIFDLSDHVQYVTRIQVNYDTTERFEFTYQTPDIIERIGRFSRYQLLIQKQAGIRDESVSVRIVLPPDAEFISASIDPQAVLELEQVALDFFFDMTNDQWIDILFEQP